MNKLKAIICVGVSASGKSSFAREQCKQWNWIDIERDIIREFIMTTQFHFPSSGNNLMVDNLYQHWKFKNESLVNAEFDLNIHRAVINKFNIVVSDTNLNKERRDALKLKLEALEYDVEIKVFGLDSNLDELWKRDLYRKNSVGVQTISAQYYKFRKEFPKYHLKDVTGKPKAVIVDIDGTITKGPNNRSPYDWHKVDNDLPNDLVVMLVNSIYKRIDYDVIFLSGRDSVCRELTINWLVEKTEIPRQYIDANLFMRKEGDMRKDTIIKLELFFEHIDGKYNVEYCLEDRAVVYRQYLDLGITPFFVGNSYLEF